MYCPVCGKNKVTQLTSMIVIMQLPGSAHDTAAYSCDECDERFYMERDNAFESSIEDGRATVTPRQLASRIEKTGERIILD